MTTATSTPATTTWNIDPAHSSAEFKVKHMMISNVKGSFSGLSGVLTEHATDSTLSSVEASIPVATISTGDAQRDGHLKSADFFDAEKYPTLDFKSTKVVRKGDAYEVTGDLTIHGVTKPVTFAVDGPSVPAKIPGEIPASGFLPRQRSTARTSGWRGMRPSRPAASWWATRSPSPSTCSSSRPPSKLGSGAGNGRPGGRQSRCRKLPVATNISLAHPIFDRQNRSRPPGALRAFPGPELPCWKQPRAPDSAAEVHHVTQSCQRDLPNQTHHRGSRRQASARLRLRQDQEFDPFLLLDDFRNENPADYLAGFPWHPHRGIETITYVLAGEVAHGDSLGNKGRMTAGDVQWMTAGSGILHQEMPKGDEHGRMHGFQLWANLPASLKMTDPRYQDIPASAIPEVTEDDGTKARIICGEFWGKTGPVEGVAAESNVAARYVDISVPPFTRKRIKVETTRNAFAYVFAGSGTFRDASEPQAVLTESAIDPNAAPGVRREKPFARAL